MILHKDSHTDHAIPQSVVDYLLSLYAARAAFFIETIDLPTDLPTVQCGLYGPAVGDNPVDESQVFYAARGERAYTSRMIADVTRATRTVTVIAGPHDGHPCVMYTAFGGPASPKEPGDPTVKPDEMEKCVAFWRAHALAK